MAAFLSPAMATLREVEGTLLSVRGRVSTAREIVSKNDLTAIGRFDSGSLRNAVTEADVLGDEVAKGIRKLERQLLDAPKSDRDRFREHLVESTEIDFRPDRQRVAFGSTVSEFDASEAEIITDRIEVEVDFDDEIPARCVADVAVGAYSHVEVRYQLIAVETRKDARWGDLQIATYAVSLESDHETLHRPLAMA